MSPAAKTPFIFVFKVLRSVFIVPHFVISKPGSSNNFGIFSASKPRAFITMSAFIVSSLPSITSGDLLPEASGSPNLILLIKTSSTFSVPLKSLGLDNQTNSIPSSSAFVTSLADPGIFSLSLLYKHDTFLAFWRIAVLTQSIAVSPPPITTTFFPSQFKFPLSKFSTLSPKPFLFDAVKNSIAG